MDSKVARMRANNKERARRKRNQRRAKRELAELINITRKHFGLNKENE